ncbi:hypothetical protein [Oleidesulfovibrio sp.]|uniref:hypothetical protein n=1 Tax=Oleidesulfovibrio sp. TaxID=2909707 RepID=UPI003A898B1C
MSLRDSSICLISVPDTQQQHYNLLLSTIETILSGKNIPTMIHLSFTSLGYVYMFLIWLIAPAYGVYHARKKGLNPYFWGILCFLVPLCVFIIVGIRAPGEPVPKMFRNEEETESNEQAGSDTAEVAADKK